MKFVDVRKDTTIPINPTLLRLKDALMVRHAKDEFSEHMTISVRDFDQKIGHIQHLQMNFEPDLNESFKRGWFVTTSKHLHSLLFEDTAWKRYAWGVYEESDEEFAKFVADALENNQQMMGILTSHFRFADSTAKRLANGVANPHPLLKEKMRLFIVEHS